MREETRAVLRTQITRLRGHVFELEHVSGDSFVAWEDLAVAIVSAWRGLGVKFVLGSEVAVKRMGVNLAAVTEEGDGVKVTWLGKKGDKDMG